MTPEEAKETFLWHDTDRIPTGTEDLSPQEGCLVAIVLIIVLIVIFGIMIVIEFNQK